MENGIEMEVEVIGCWLSYWLFIIISYWQSGSGFSRLSFAKRKATRDIELFKRQAASLE